MKYNVLFLSVFLIVSLVATSQVQIPSVKAQEQNGGSFGNPYLPPSASVNWTKFWKIFNAHSAWDLEYNNGSGWISDKTALQIIREYYTVGLGEWYPRNKSEATTCKITLNFTAPYMADYRLTFGIDLDVKNYSYRESKWQYQISYQNHTVVFDWSDLKNYTGLIYSHGIKPIGDDTYFWFRVRRNNIPEGYNVLLDPSFGYDIIGGTEYTFNNRQLGTHFLCPEDCDVTNISAYLHPGFGCDAYNLSYAIYEGTTTDPTNLVAQTPVYDIADDTEKWYTINFASPVSLTGNVRYHLAMWGDDDYTTFCHYDANASYDNWRNDADFDGFTPPGNWSNYDPMVEDYDYPDFVWSIFCNYTTNGVQEYEYNLSELINPSESLDYDAEKQFIHAETVIIMSYMQFQKEVAIQLFELLETVKVYSVLDYGKEVTLEFFEFFESVHPYALLDRDFEVITPSVDVTTFGTIALVIAIIALAIGIVAFTRRS